VYHPGGFAYEISRGCTGLVGAGLLVVAITAYPASFGRRLVGISISVPTFLTLNMVRLVHLFFLGVHRPEVFHIHHEVVWQLGMALAVFGLWFGWTMWANRAGGSDRQSQRPLSPQRPLRIPALGDLRA
jgi:exosortase/archaeosortase family protein